MKTTKAWTILAAGILAVGCAAGTTAQQSAGKAENTFAPAAPLPAPAQPESAPEAQSRSSDESADFGAEPAPFPGVPEL